MTDEARRKKSVVVLSGSVTQTLKAQVRENKSQKTKRTLGLLPRCRQVEGGVHTQQLLMTDQDLHKTCEHSDVQEEQNLKHS